MNLIELIEIASSEEKFVLVIRLLILEIPVNKAYIELELAYNRTHKI